MKRLIMLFALMLLVIPFTVNAKVQTTGLVETLKAEGITPSFKNYKENDNQVIIYLFRGSGCPHCYDFLEFLDSIADEYGKKFKLVSYEVYYNQDNLDLKNKVGDFLDQPSSGVPYIVIGDKVFIGYGDSYADQVKSKIDEMYKLKKSERYDVMKEMNKKEMDPSTKVIIANVIITALASLGIVCYTNQKYKQLSLELNKANKKTK